MKVLCIFGRYTIGDPSRGSTAEYDAFLPALRRLGHTVVHLDSTHRTNYPSFGDFNTEVLATVHRERPDVVLTVQRDYELWIETLDVIRSTFDCATVCWATDDSWKYREVSRFIGRHYDAMATTYDYRIAAYRRDGVEYPILTQWAVSSDALVEPVRAGACRWDVTFVGARYGHRDKMVRELERNGIEVQCFGHGWANGTVPAEDIPRIVRNSRISLNFSRPGAGKSGPNQIKARTFDVPGAGGFLLTETAPGIEAYYVIGSEIEVFTDSREAVEKIKHYLADPGRRDEIAWAGWARTRAEHTYERRLSAVLDAAIEARRRRLAQGKSLACRTGWNDGFNPLDVESFRVALEKYNRIPAALRFARDLLIRICSLIWGRVRGRRAARRIIFELSWRFLGESTFSSATLPGRLFPEQ
jgi:spore maturation protein CgeB